jgi:hypothetical protein
MPLSRFSVVLKTLHQLGPGPLALNVLYRIGVKTGHYERAEGKGLAIGGEEIKGLFKLPGRDALRRVLGVEGEKVLLLQADEIVSGKVRIFGGEPIPLQLASTNPSGTGLPDSILDCSPPSLVS